MQAHRYKHTYTTSIMCTLILPFSFMLLHCNLPFESMYTNMCNYHHAHTMIFCDIACFSGTMANDYSVIIMQPNNYCRIQGLVIVCRCTSCKHRYIQCTRVHIDCSLICKQRQIHNYLDCSYSYITTQKCQIDDCST